MKNIVTACLFFMACQISFFFMIISIILTVELQNMIYIYTIFPTGLLLGILLIYLGFRKK